MADTKVQILEAIESHLATETAPGGDLDDAKSYSVKYTTTEIPPEYGYPLPTIMVDPLSDQVFPISIPEIMTRKEYLIRFRVLFENNGDTDRKEAAQLLDLVETAFYARTFRLAEWVDVISKDLMVPTAPPYEGPVNGAATMIMRYIHIDVRAIPT
jgi:hypothetical protein